MDTHILSNMPFAIFRWIRMTVTHLGHWIRVVVLGWWHHHPPLRLGPYDPGAECLPQLSLQVRGHSVDSHGVVHVVIGRRGHNTVVRWGCGHDVAGIVDHRVGVLDLFTPLITRKVDE